MLARDGEARPEHLLEKTLQHRRHGAEPERVDDYQVVGPADGLLALTDRRRQLGVFPLLRRPQKRDLGLGDRDLPHRMAGYLRGLRIGGCERMAEARLVGIGMPVDDGDMSCHAIFAPRSRPRSAIDTAMNRAQ
jgi:hypothetical protein